MHFQYDRLQQPKAALRSQNSNLRLWLWLHTRTVARKFSLGALCISARGFRFVRGAWHSKHWPTLNWFIVFHISIWGTWSFVWRAKPPKNPWRRDCSTHLKFLAPDPAPTSKNFWVRLLNDLVSCKPKNIVLFVKLYYYTSIDEVSRNNAFNG